MKNTNDYIEINSVCTLLLNKGYAEGHPNAQLPGFSKRMLNLINDLPPVNTGAPLAATLLLKKIPSYGVDIIVKDWLVYIIDLCANGNPGYLQLIYKKLLTGINNFKYHGMGIPKNYEITAEDFALVFPKEFPIINNPKIAEKYSKMWDEQKCDRNHPNGIDNKVDTAEYWLEVMEK